MNAVRITSVLAVLTAAVFCLACLPGLSSAEVDNDQGTVTYYTYTVDFQFQGTDAQWIQWDFGFKDSNDVEVTSTEWNPSGIVFPAKGTYTVIQTVGNTVGTYVSQLRINIMGTPEITFESNGGSSVPMQTVKVGNKVTEPSAPVKDGYTFSGWYKESSLLNRYSFDQPVSQHMTLYAKWTSAGGAGDDGNDGDSNSDDEKGDTDEYGSVFYVGDVTVNNIWASVFLIVIGVLAAYVGDKKECSKAILIGAIIAILGAICLFSDIDLIGFLGFGGVRL